MFDLRVCQRWIGFSENASLVGPMPKESPQAQYLERRL
jgi:hypothetical protein